MRKFVTLSIILFLSAVTALTLRAEQSLRPDSPDLPDDFVSVSILAAAPGDALYSLAGHIAIRMKCPYHNLDYVFTYESEDASRKVVRFLMGKLKMGLVSMTPEEYLSNYESKGRGVKEYPVHMPLSARQNLWKILDNHLSEGINLPYDYLRRGCALSTVRFLKEGLDTIPIIYDRFPEQFKLTRREITRRQMGCYPWTWAFLNLICNKPIDSFCPPEQKIIMPADFLEVMSRASVCGETLLGPPTELLPEVKTPKPWRFTPLHLSLIILLLTILSLFAGRKEMIYILLGIQTALGAVSTYLVFFSSLCCTQWSWLLIPFNPLPAILWKWRSKWAPGFGIVSLIWALVMAVLPHMVTDWPYIILAATIGIACIWDKFWVRSKITRKSCRENPQSVC